MIELYEFVSLLVVNDNALMCRGSSVYDSVLYFKHSFTNLPIYQEPVSPEYTGEHNCWSLVVWASSWTFSPEWKLCTTWYDCDTVEGEKQIPLPIRRSSRWVFFFICTIIQSRCWPFSRIGRSRNSTLNTRRCHRIQSCLVNVLLVSC